MNYLFDIDGTLTEPRQKISLEFEEFFYNWMQNKKVFLVTGSDMPKVKEQLSQRIIDSCSGVFCSMANEFYIGNKNVYKNELKLPEGFMDWLKEQFNNSPYTPKRGNNFEMRSGMLNFSIAGRDSTVDERNAYNAYDIESNERNIIAEEINTKYGDLLEACVGGQISIDIQNVGNNKSLASKWIRSNIGGDIIFFGDKTMVGGNDRAIVEDIMDSMNGPSACYQISNPSNLQKILEKI